MNLFIQRIQILNKLGGGGVAFSGEGEGEG